MVKESGCTTLDCDQLLLGDFLCIVSGGFEFFSGGSVMLYLTHLGHFDEKHKKI